MFDHAEYCDRERRFSVDKKTLTISAIITVPLVAVFITGKSFEGGLANAVSGAAVTFLIVWGIVSLVRYFKHRRERPTLATGK